MKLLLILALSWAGAECYHILCVIPTPTHSHHTLGKGVVDSLLKAGHEVTWATPYPPKKAQKNLNIIDVSLTIKIFEGLNMIEIAKDGLKGLALVKSFGQNISLTALTPELKTALVTTQFDAVVTEMFFSEADAGYAAIQQVPWILLYSGSATPNLLSLVDTVSSVPIMPMVFTDYSIPMNFWQRLVTAGIYAAMVVNDWMDATTPALYNSMFGPLAAARGVTLPPFREAVGNISVLLTNSHPSFSIALSLPPNVVEIAGYHIDENIAPLPKDLQDLLDSSPQGVVYFSMGSVLKSAFFPEHTRRELLRVLGAIPQTVLWKFEEELQEVPSNVHVRKWMPQTSILAHPNIKVFITHGGVLSNMEAIFHGVPLIMIPLYGDQPYNANRAAREGYAVKLEFNVDTMAGQVEGALKQILGNRRYQQRAKQLSALFRTRPVHPTKLISHYIEMAIESKGAYHLRSKALQYTWYQRNMLDVAAFIIGVLIVTLLLLRKIVKFVINIFQTNSRKSATMKKKKVKKNN